MTDLDYYFYLRTLDGPGSAGRDAPPREVPMLRDAMITFRYQMRLLLREPVWIVTVVAVVAAAVAAGAGCITPRPVRRGASARSG